MSGLQRSEVSFRRQGSSGFVWDDRFLSEELNKVNNHKDQDQEHQYQDQDNNEKIHASQPSPPGSTNSNTGGRGYRPGKVSPSAEPSSPKLSACGFCGAFGKTGDKG